MAVRILLAFESLEHIVGVGITRLGCRCCSVVGACAGAALEHYRGFGPRDPRLELFEESWIALAARVRVPFDQYRFRNMTDIVPLGLGAHVDQFRSEERRVGKECRSRWSP